MSIFEVETLLNQADGFVRGGDYLGARARAQCARIHLAKNAPSSSDVAVREAAIRDRIDLVIARCDQLVQRWRSEVARRQEAYLTRERSAIAPLAR